MEIRPIQVGDDGQAATRQLVRKMESIAAAGSLEYAEDALRALRSLESVDRRYGGTAPVALEGIEDAVTAALASLAHHEAQEGVADVITGVALWAIRHQVALEVVEPVANALARRSNEAASKAELSAIVGLMHGVIAHVAERLAPDLERSNPERPWRILHVNLAITAIRTEDPALLDLAFDALDQGLPDEAGGFYGEALALALAPGISPAVKERIEARHLEWTSR